MTLQVQTTAFLSTATKRPRSAERSGSGTPSNAHGDPVTASSPDIRLPPFLRQSKSELFAKFTHLAWQQQTRLDHPATSGDPDSPWLLDCSHESRLRNRYIDIKPWKNSRIKLRVPEGTSDYINASPIKLHCSVTGSERNYIAAQGPKRSCVNDFWQMVWHETSPEVGVIIMLTQLAEGMREKCFRYYPEDHETEGIALSFTDDTGEAHGGCVVAESPTEYDSDTRSAVRRLRLTYNGRSKTVYHFFFLAWPDFGVPEAADRVSLLKLLALSRRINGGWANPRIVHCSAGVGRSGTFIALEHLIADLENGAMDDFMDEGERKQQDGEGEGEGNIGRDVPQLLQQRLLQQQQQQQQQHQLIREEGSESSESSEATGKQSSSGRLQDQDPIFETVNRLREQRMTMVQSETQFSFLYDTLAEAYSRRWLERKAAGLLVEDEEDNNDDNEGSGKGGHSSGEIDNSNNKIGGGGTAAASGVSTSTSTSSNTTINHAATVSNGDVPLPQHQHQQQQHAPPAEKNKPSGEPSPKAMRLSRGLRRVLADMRERSRSAQRRGGTGDQPIPPPSPQSPLPAPPPQQQQQQQLETSASASAGAAGQSAVLDDKLEREDEEMTGMEGVTMSAEEADVLVPTPTMTTTTTTTTTPLVTTTLVSSTGQSSPAEGINYRLSVRVPGPAGSGNGSGSSTSDFISQRPSLMVAVALTAIMVSLFFFER